MQPASAPANAKATRMCSNLRATSCYAPFAKDEIEMHAQRISWASSGECRSNRLFQITAMIAGATRICGNRARSVWRISPWRCRVRSAPSCPKAARNHLAIIEVGDRGEAPAPVAGRVRAGWPRPSIRGGGNDAAPATSSPDLVSREAFRARPLARVFRGLGRGRDRTPGIGQGRNPPDRSGAVSQILVAPAIIAVILEKPVERHSPLDAHDIAARASRSHLCERA